MIAPFPKRLPSIRRGTALSFRISPAMKQRLVEGAKRNDVSLSAHAERLIELGWIFETMLDMADKKRD